MTEAILEKDEYHCQYRNKVCFGIVCIGIGFFINSSILKYSIKSNFSIESKLNVLTYQETQIKYFDKNVNEYISKFRCTGSKNDIGTWRERLCVFSNICYNRYVNLFYSIFITFTTRRYTMVTYRC